ncbi:MAG: NUDIX domain-containing protein [Defluviitaleaceae bacterium]|nr:NUDIX domain-containing protein [Defluviitaleaceae bacterium]MCL2836865.1 NUDIX domain-containing protein [Defluviitaleaceae bacterium]
MGEFIVAQKSLVIFDKKVLLLQKSGIIWKEYEGKWELPGGRLEFGESLPEGLAREIQEETGLSVYTDRLLCAAASVPARQKQFVFLFYLSHANTGTVTLSEEHKDFMWATRSQLLELADYSFLQGFSLHELLGDLEID